jgi:hypothetical protein
VIKKRLHVLGRHAVLEERLPDSRRRSWNSIAASSRWHWVLGLPLFSRSGSVPCAFRTALA